MKLLEITLTVMLVVTMLVLGGLYFNLPTTESMSDEFTYTLEDIEALCDDNTSCAVEDNYILNEGDTND